MQRVLTGPCFVCAILAGDPAYPHDDVYEDDETIAFLVRYPTLLGHLVVAPNGVARTLPTERMYALSLGSQQGNKHLHWHVAPPPPGVPYEQQQFYALMSEHGVLDVTPESQTALATPTHRDLLSTPHSRSPADSVQRPSMKNCRPRLVAAGCCSLPLDLLALPLVIPWEGHWQLERVARVVPSTIRGRCYAARNRPRRHRGACRTCAAAWPESG
jgi:diadenosine tetraphosphate (Ap4A) HIT family hydrolase